MGARAYRLKRATWQREPPFSVNHLTVGPGCQILERHITNSRRRQPRGTFAGRSRALGARPLAAAYAAMGRARPGPTRGETGALKNRFEERPPARTSLACWCFYVMSTHDLGTVNHLLQSYPLTPECRAAAIERADELARDP